MRCPARVGRWYVAERVGWHWAGLGKAICRWSPDISQRGGGVRQRWLAQLYKYSSAASSISPFLARRHACEETSSTFTKHHHQHQTTKVYKLAEALH